MKVTVAVEYLNRFETYFINTAADLRSLVEEVDHPNIRMMYDTFHGNIEEKSIYESAKSCGDCLAHVHISENDRSTPGEGHVAFETTFKTLKEVGYEGWLTIEAFGLALPDLAAATRIWRKMYPSQEHLTTKGLEFMKKGMEG